MYKCLVKCLEFTYENNTTVPVGFLSQDLVIPECYAVRTYVKNPTVMQSGEMTIFEPDIGLQAETGLLIAKSISNNF